VKTIRNGDEAERNWTGRKHHLKPFYLRICFIPTRGRVSEAGKPDGRWPKMVSR